jgi:hypothetical protein
MQFYKGRTLKVGQMVRVYVNLNKQGWFSLADHSTGYVLAHAKSLLLQDVSFHFRESGRQRVLDSRRRNVHAWAIGTFLCADIERPIELDQPVRYNPYVGEGFFCDSGETIKHSDVAYFDNKVCYVKGFD